MSGARGERQIEAAMREAQKAATRNADKGCWRRWSIKRLFEKLDEEVLEYEFAVLDGNPERIREELGDCIWTLTMIADHDMALELERVPNYHLGSE